MTINGKIRPSMTSRIRKVTSTGAIDLVTDYTDYSVAYDQAFGSGAYWQDRNGNPLPTPQQEIIGRDRFEKGSNELRLASPSTDRFRFIVGLFQERQSHWIIQDYQIQGFGPQISVPGWPNTIWLTDQDRVDRDEEPPSARRRVRRDQAHLDHRRHSRLSLQEHPVRVLWLRRGL